MFQDWYFNCEQIEEFEAGCDYELEHPGWQCEWDVRMANEFPVLVVGVEW